MAKPITTVQRLIRRLQNHKPGDPIKIRVRGVKKDYIIEDIDLDIYEQMNNHESIVLIMLNEVKK